MLTSFTGQSVPDRGSGLSIILGMLRPRPVRTFTFLVMITAKAFSQASTLLLTSRRRSRVRNLSRSSITPTCRAAAREAQQISPQPIIMLLQQPRICARSHDCHVLFAMISPSPSRSSNKPPESIHLATNPRRASFFVMYSAPNYVERACTPSCVPQLAGTKCSTNMMDEVSNRGSW